MVRDKTQQLYGLPAAYLWKFNALRFGDRIVPGVSMMFPNQILVHDNYLILIRKITANCITCKTYIFCG